MKDTPTNGNKTLSISVCGPFGPNPRTFDCPVFIAVEDKQWCCRADKDGRRRLITTDVEKIHDGVTAVKLGGHFPGSLVLHWEKKLFIADTFVTVPVSLGWKSWIMGICRYAKTAQSGLYHVDRPSGTTSFSFMWSIPNMIPLPPSEMYKMWEGLKPFDFNSTHGAFMGMDIRSGDVKRRVLESMKIQTRGEGHGIHALLDESEE
ncbi:MAG: hypothetical protein Q9157_006880 [Trypethelium eluteriae]